MFLEESSIIEKEDEWGEWLHVLASNNTVLETLNFYMTDLGRIRFEDLKFVARNCPSLTSVKISDCEILYLAGFFCHATAFVEVPSIVNQRCTQLYHCHESYVVWV